MPRKKRRTVWVDSGHMTNECWGPAEVIDSRQCNNLFGGGTSEDLLVEVLGGERIWVSSWRDDNPYEEVVA